MKRIPYVAACLAAILSACTVTYPGYPIPPKPRSELVPAPPKSSVSLIWRPGYYDWTGAGYTWHPGRWVDRRGHGTLWQDGYWRFVNGAYIWVPAHWL